MASNNHARRSFATWEAMPQSCSTAPTTVSRRSRAGPRVVTTWRASRNAGGLEGRGRATWGQAWLYAKRRWAPKGMLAYVLPAFAETCASVRQHRDGVPPSRVNGETKWCQQWLVPLVKAAGRSLAPRCGVRPWQAHRGSCPELSHLRPPLRPLRGRRAPLPIRAVRPERPALRLWGRLLGGRPADATAPAGARRDRQGLAEAPQQKHPHVRAWQQELGCTGACLGQHQGA